MKFILAVFILLITNSLQASTQEDMAISISDRSLDARLFQSAVLASIAQKELSKEVVINNEILKRYETYRIATLGGIPLALLGVSSSFGTYAATTALMANPASINSLVKSLATISRNSLFLVIDTGFSLKNAAFGSFNSIKNILGLIVGQQLAPKMAYASASIGAVAFLGGMSFSSFYNSKEAMNVKSARKLLFYDSNLRKEVDIVLESISEYFPLKKGSMSTLREEIFTRLVEQGVENKFDKKVTYKVDIIEIMREKDLVDSEFLNRAEALVKSYEGIENKRELASQKSYLLEKVNIVTSFAAYMEQALLDENLSESLKRELQKELIKVKRTLRVIESNFK